MAKSSLTTEDKKWIEKFVATKRGILLWRSLIRDFLEGAIRDGKIDPRGKTNEQLKEQIVDFLKIIRSKKRRIIVFQSDFRPSLLKEARRYREANDNELSCTLYAIWIEHWINHIIVTIGQRNKINIDDLQQIIRELNIRAKLTWLLKLLGVPSIKQSHYTRILHLMDLRNSYVHYKWLSRAEEHETKYDEDLENTLQGIESTIKYLRKFENRHVYHGQRLRVKTMLFSNKNILPPNQALKLTG
ncbi:MAG: hypothetical protein ABSC53_15560 [Bacteroidota bacterium]|jgi:hypothetical protein